jgi:demethylmenaquinone methyltransferase/2-methoxy-6-polyprenyl-1,4-benzoquinol methylase
MRVDADLRRSMFRYYDERAPEYEDAYRLGTGTASITNPVLFQTEARILAEIVSRNARGRVGDIACGTGFWLQFYASAATRITLIDQSPGMLHECRQKVDALAIGDRTSIVRADVLQWPFNEASFDFTLVGFLLSHLTEDHEQELFAALRRSLSSSGRLLILDSAWSIERSRFNAKEERQRRRLNDGTTFDIYKRYLDQNDIQRWRDAYGLHTSMEHLGAAFIAVAATFERPALR